MAKKRWLVNVNGTNHQIVFLHDFWWGKKKLVIDGYEQELERTAFLAFVGLDQIIRLGNKECHFVFIDNKADIAVDGFFIDSNKVYRPIKSIPWWLWIFAAACAAVPIAAFTGGPRNGILGIAIPFEIAFLGSLYCIRISVSPYINLLVKLLSCLAITSAVWGLFKLLSYLINEVVTWF